MKKYYKYKYNMVIEIDDVNKTAKLFVGEYELDNIWNVVYDDDGVYLDYKITVENVISEYLPCVTAHWYVVGHDKDDVMDESNWGNGMETLDDAIGWAKRLKSIGCNEACVGILDEEKNEIIGIVTERLTGWEIDYE